MDIPTDSGEGRLVASTFDNLIGKEVESSNRRVFLCVCVVFVCLFCS